jgi:phosphoglycolate phosphatase-like HAD superfamily hydrolase
VSQTLDPSQRLRDFRPSRDFFVGIDSDGCAFDTMEVKHKECFIPEFIKHFRLEAVSRFAREVSEFVNLYSRDRGTNRFPAYLKTLDLLATRPEVQRRGFLVPKLAGLRDWAARETKLANPALKAEVERTHDPDLTLALAWSVDVNRSIEETVRHVPPFPWVRESLEKLEGKADAMVASATPVEALVREWETHDLAGLVALIAGQEFGGKREHLAIAAGPERYARDHVLMVGDAPGDHQAALANCVLFYPINPGAEEASWRRFHDEALARFFDGTYAGEYMARCVEEFENLLPQSPPWKSA